MLDRIETVVSMTLLLAVGGTALAGPEQRSRPAVRDGEVRSPLPRWREGGTPPVSPDQALYPYAVTSEANLQAPTSGVIASPQPRQTRRAAQPPRAH